MRPPACRGRNAYHEMYAGSSQKYTMGCPVHQNSVRASSGSTPRVRPSDQGISMTTTSTTRPSAATTHISHVATLMYVTTGVTRPGWARFQASHSHTTCPATSRLAATMTAAPM